jgi:drug/metabolite transporter (DMT)-like permease
LSNGAQSSRTPAYVVMLLVPLFFSSNVVLGRLIGGDVTPFILAALRWSAVALLLAPVIYIWRRDVLKTLRTAPGLLLLLGFLGMAVCGAGVYFALRLTSATNGTLIYTTSPVIILILERFFRGRQITTREAIGSAVAFLGVAIIVLRGSPAALLALEFNLGDLVFVAAAIAWAAYSILYRSPALSGLPNLAGFALLSTIGAVMLIPAALIEWTLGGTLPMSTQSWGGLAGIVLFASLLAFTGFQFGIMRLGASTAGAFMYLLPPFGVGMSVLFLGETLQAFHLIGIAAVTIGIVLATAPASWFRGAQL